MAIRRANEIAITEERAVSFIKGQSGEVESSKSEAGEPRKEEEKEREGC